MSLPARLLILVTIAVLPALATQVYNEYELRRARTAEVRDLTQRYAHFIAAEQDNIVDGTRQLLSALTQLPQIQSGNAAECGVVLASLNGQYPNYDRLAAFDVTGRLICSSTPARASDALELSLPHIRAAIADNRFTISDYQVRPDTNARIVEFALPLHDESKNITGVAVAALNLDWLTSILAEKPIPREIAISIIDSRGTVIASTPDPIWVGSRLPQNLLDSLRPTVLPEDRAGLELNDPKGIARIYSEVPSTLFPGQFFVIAGFDKSATLSAINQSTVRAATLILTGLALALLAAWVGGDHFLRRPLNILLQAATRWRAGDWSVRAALPDKSSEIGRLGQAFDAMADVLSDREAQLNRSKNDAESASRAKTNFLANMSHELRTPLNAVIGFSEMLKDGYAGSLSNKQREYIDDIYGSGRHLLELVGDILDMSTIEAGKLEVHPVLVPVRRAIEGAANLIQARATAGALALIIEVPDNLPLLYVDHVRFRQILLNLLSNAVKFTPRGGSVTVSAASDGEEIVISVADTGIGMRPEDIPQALQPFRQVENPFSRQNDGVGLGLPLAKTLTELHGGKLEITSALRRGTVVTLRFPRHASAEVHDIGEARSRSRALS
ncbi:MAG TPA: sensor histidine kinase [Stellaceae bacterium]|nr:sensor histidine kinase [Stellaceae bacterium]